MWAANEGQTAVIEPLVKARPSLSDCESRFNHSTALMFAACEGQAAVIKPLVKAGEDPNAKNLFGLSALMLAAAHGQAAVIEPLVDAGADPNAKDDHGQTALMWAKAGKHKAVVKILERMCGNSNNNIQHFKQERPYGNGSCSLDSCPCGGHSSHIQRGFGYLYIPASAVDFRRDCLTIRRVY